MRQGPSLREPPELTESHVEQLRRVEPGKQGAEKGGRQ